MLVHLNTVSLQQSRFNPSPRARESFVEVVGVRAAHAVSTSLVLSPDLFHRKMDLCFVIFPRVCNGCSPAKFQFRWLCATCPTLALASHAVVRSFVGWHTTLTTSSFRHACSSVRRPHRPRTTTVGNTPTFGTQSNHTVKYIYRPSGTNHLCVFIVFSLAVCVCCYCKKDSLSTTRTSK